MSVTVSKDGKSKADDRAERLAAALKENLRRRKAQVRNRRDAERKDAETGDDRGVDGSTSANAKAVPPGGDGNM